MAPRIATVVVCHDSADGLAPTLESVLAQQEEGDELVVVDNASTDASVAIARDVAPRATVIETGANLGFAGGTRVGAEASRAELILFLNPDCVLADGCLAALRAVSAQRPEWGAWQALVTMEGGTQVNTSGNVVHLLGIAWAGGVGTSPDDVPTQPHDVAFASGAALVVRRAAWDAVGGFDARFFMYMEDLDLSLRLRLAGWGLGVVPDARVDHDYAFAKGDYKWFYLERNRWWTVLGTYPAPLLVLVAPLLVAFDLALLPVALRGRWLGPKLRANAAALRELPAIRARRRTIQRTRQVSPRTFAAGLTARLDSPYLGPAARIPGVAAALDAYFRLVLAVLGRAGR